MAFQVYTSTPLVTRLGIAEGMRVYTINPPKNYLELLGKLPNEVEIMTKTDRKVECVHIFLEESDSLEKTLEDAKNHIYSMGMIWVSWPRKDEQKLYNEQQIKKSAYQLGLKDEKFTLIDDYWCGLLLRISR